MAKLLQTQGLQGAVWATLDSNAMLVGAAGVKNARTGKKMRPDDRVHVGSVAKTLLAAGVLRLVSQGRLSLETPVSVLLPDVAFENRWADSAPVRLRHLLDHTSGLDDARFFQVFSLAPGPDTPLADGFIGPDSLLRLRSRPGAHSSYSNMGYTLLGRVIESVTGERYESYLEAHLLRPLGMLESSFSFVTQAGPRGDPRLAMATLKTVPRTLPFPRTCVQRASSLAPRPTWENSRAS
nr:serine hydrolase domain-containing protein [Massilia glaciei]